VLDVDAGDVHVSRLWTWRYGSHAGSSELERARRH